MRARLVLLALLVLMVSGKPTREVLSRIIAGRNGLQRAATLWCAVSSGDAVPDGDGEEAAGAVRLLFCWGNGRMQSTAVQLVGLFRFWDDFQSRYRRQLNISSKETAI